MKTSNKLLLGLLLVILSLAIWFIGTAKYYAVDKSVKGNGQMELEIRVK